MKKLLVFLTFLIILVNSSVFEQNENENCPPLYTRTKIQISNATVMRMEVEDANKFSKLPKFVLSLDSLSKLIKSPAIAARAGVTGDVIIRIKINSSGRVSSANIEKGIGSGCDDSALNVLLKSKFYPAQINNEKAESEIKVWINFYLIEAIDKLDIYFDEIKYEEKIGELYKILILNNLDRAVYLERINYENKNSKGGEIPLGLYTSLNDFIVSQCFLNYKDHYSYYISPPKSTVTVTVKYGSTEKSVFTNGDAGDPIGFWAITKLILYIKDQISWEDVEK